MTTTITHALAEQSEAETLYDVETSAPAATKAGLGMASIRVGGGVAVSVRDDPTGYWSKALGFGFGEPVTAALIDEIGDFYRSQKTPMAVLQLAPSVLPGDWAGICAKANLSAAGSWVKLARDLSAGQGRPPAQLGADLRTGRIEAGHAREMASVMLRAFGMPEQHLSGMLAAVVGRPGWRAHGIWAGTELASAALMRIHRNTAQCFGAATLPHARGKGAQSALLTARAEDARSAGCRWLIAETGVEAPGTHNSSLHNLLRNGFTVMYERQNWIWRPVGQSP